MCKISVIIPVFNVEKYLKKNIESLLNQTFKDIEIIFVNDGSTDNSLGILEEYEDKYSFIKVLKKENGGLSSARNLGIKEAKGEFIVFIDSDDYINNIFLESLYKKIIETKADIAICEVIYFNDLDEKIIRKNTVEYNDSILTGKESFREFLLRKNVENYAWNKMYKKSLFIKNNIFYPEGKYYEDAFTTYKLLYLSKKVVFQTDAKYYYRQRLGSITKEGFSYKDMHYIEALKEIRNFIIKENIYFELINEFQKYYLEVYMSKVKKLLFTKNNKDYKLFLNDLIQNFDLKEINYTNPYIGIKVMIPTCIWIIFVKIYNFFIKRIN